MFVSVGSCIFNNRVAAVLGSDANTKGAALTDIVKSLPAGGERERALAVQTVVSGIFRLAMGMAIASFVFSLGVEWRSMKSKKQSSDEEPSEASSTESDQGEKTGNR